MLIRRTIRFEYLSRDFCLGGDVLETGDDLANCQFTAVGFGWITVTLEEEGDEV
jgi:hypothetical protein